MQVATVSHDCSVVLKHSEEEMSLLVHRQIQYTLCRYMYVQYTDDCMRRIQISVCSIPGSVCLLFLPYPQLGRNYPVLVKPKDGLKVCIRSWPHHYWPALRGLDRDNWMSVSTLGLVSVPHPPNQRGGGIWYTYVHSNLQFVEFQRHEYI